mmetsp:Transcript_8432/g.23797  ORF Transcript_8432/g.23797 Transcript_8432/m.23797 type:complete len:265 (-) Transcript_8432:1609-2403(-)
MYVSGLAVSDRAGKPLPAQLRRAGVPGHGAPGAPLALLCLGQLPAVVGRLRGHRPQAAAAPRPHDLTLPRAHAQGVQQQLPVQGRLRPVRLEPAAERRRRRPAALWPRVHQRREAQARGPRLLQGRGAAPRPRVSRLACGRAAEVRGLGQGKVRRIIIVQDLAHRLEVPLVQEGHLVQRDRPLVLLSRPHRQALEERVEVADPLHLEARPLQLVVGDAPGLLGVERLEAALDRPEVEVGPLLEGVQQLEAGLVEVLHADEPVQV